MQSRDNVLLTDLYELTMCASYFDNKIDTLATFDLFIRHFPRNRSYFIACGLKDILTYLENLKFSEEQIRFLKSKGIFKNDFLNYLRRLRFTGDVWAIPEGTVFFPNEPVLRITAPIIEAQLVETYLLNSINLQTTIATKASRVVLAAKDKPVVDFSLRRTQGEDAGMKVARASYIAGCIGTSNVLAGMEYNIPVYGTMAHSFVMAFHKEEESFLAYTKTFPNNSILLVDTYNTMKGVKKAIHVAKELEKRGYRLKAVRLDSGNLVLLSRNVRKVLDESGLKYVKIFASGNLDEYKIENLLKKGALIDAFGVGTAMGVSKDAPYCDVIYKLSGLGDKKKILPTMKLSKGKVTYPGKKQIYRIIDKKGKYVKDILGLEGEKIKGKRLLIKVMQKGKIIYNIPEIESIRKRTLENLSRLPEKYKCLRNAERFNVEISPQLERLTSRLMESLKVKI
jgi:nicotinate phosphoribosyltransferase